MTINESRWAMTHDWFVEMVCKNGQIGVMVRDDSTAKGTRTFYSLQALRNWAGY